MATGLTSLRQQGWVPFAGPGSTATH